MYASELLNLWLSFYGYWSRRIPSSKQQKNEEWYWYGDWLNTLRVKPNFYHFTDEIFKCIFLNENAWISLQISFIEPMHRNKPNITYLIQISLKFVPQIPNNNIPALVQIMAWHRPGNKPLSEPMVISLLIIIKCVLFIVSKIQN